MDRTTSYILLQNAMKSCLKSKAICIGLPHASSTKITEAANNSHQHPNGIKNVSLRMIKNFNAKHKKGLNKLVVW